MFAKEKIISAAEVVYAFFWLKHEMEISVLTMHKQSEFFMFVDFGVKRFLQSRKPYARHLQCFVSLRQHTYVQ